MKAFARVGGVPVPVIRSVGGVQRAQRARVRALFTKAEHPACYTLVWTDDKQQELDIHTGDEPPERPWGLLIPPHRSLELGLRAMEVG